MNHPLASRTRSCATALVVAAALALGCAPTRTDIRGPSPVAAPESEPAEAPASDAELTRPETEPPAPASEVLPPEPSPEQVERAALRERIVDAARALLGSRVRLDCSGYVVAVYRQAGLTLGLPPARTRSQSLRAAGREVATPEPGDLAFFHDTYARSRNGRANGGVTHVALVEAVEGSAVTLLHRGLREVERFRMDLDRPWDRTLNDPVRVRRPHDVRGTRYLSGELFTAFGALLDVAVTQSLQARNEADTRDRHPPKRWQTARARISKSEPAPSRSMRRRARSSSSSAACTGSCPPTRRSSSRSSGSGGPGAPSSPAP
jgi:hypothetical protein